MLTEPEETDPVQNFIYGWERDFKENRHLERMKRGGRRATGGTNYSRAGDSTQVNHRLAARHERGSMRFRAARLCLGLLGTSK